MPRLPAPKLPDWLESMVPFQRYLIQSGDLHFHVMENGTGLPVLMLHGNPMWGFLYRRVCRELTRGYRSVMPDLIGLGFSSRPRDPQWHTLENHAASLLTLLRELNLGEFVLVCHDWGGPIGLLAAAQIPDQLAGLVVLNTVTGPPRPGFKPTKFHSFSHLPLVSQLAFRLLGFPQNMVWMVQQNRESISGPIARAYRYPLRGFSRNSAPLALARMVPDSFFHPSIRGLQQVQDFVQEYRGPCAIVWGDNDPILGSVRKRVEALLPEARVIATEAGHYLQEEVPGKIADAIRDVAGRT